jgi:hypothetical protein
MARWRNTTLARSISTLSFASLSHFGFFFFLANAPKFDGILTNKIDFNKQDELSPRQTGAAKDNRSGPLTLLSLAPGQRLSFG